MTKTWICTSCGKTADTPYGFSDVSCAANCIQVYKEKLDYDHPDYMIFIEDGGIVEPQPEWGEDEEN